MTKICQTFLMVSVAYGQGGRMRGMHLQPAIFKNVFDEGLYNFVIISNLFHSNKPYAFSTYIKNVRTKCIIYGEALRIRVKKFKRNLRENYSKSIQIAITACKFSKFFRGSMPPDPLESFLCLNQLQISCAEKNTLKKTWKL